MSNCILGRFPDGDQCNPGECRGCGWLPREAARRKALIEAGVMHTYPDGSQGLVIRPDKEYRRSWIYEINS